MRIADLLDAGGRAPKPPPLTCGQTVENAARRMERFGVRLLPICRGDGTIAGVIGERDIVVKAVARGRAPALCTVDEVMSTRYLSCDSEDTVETLMRLFAESDADCVLIRGRDGKLLGTVERDELPVQPSLAAFGQLTAPTRARRRVGTHTD
jgi:CBS domain-containing protein